MSTIRCISAVSLVTAAALAGPALADTSDPISITRFSVSHATFDAARGTVFGVTLSSPAPISIEIAKRSSGYELQGDCMPRTASNRDKLLDATRATWETSDDQTSRLLAAAVIDDAACTRLVPVGTIVRRSSPADSYTVKFSGRFPGKRLAAGKYLATLVAGDATATRRLRVR